MKYPQDNPTNEEVDVSGVHVLVTAAYNALLEFVDALLEVVDALLEVVDALMGDGEDSSEITKGKFERMRNV
jgi:hypothetical protein